MKIAFDLDGTIGAHPAVLIALAKVLQRGGAEVFVLTAAAGELPAPQRPAEVAKRLSRLGGAGLRIVCVESSDKPSYCATHGVDILIDDTPFPNLTRTVQLLPGSALRAAASTILLSR